MKMPPAQNYDPQTSGTSTFLWAKWKTFNVNPKCFSIAYEKCLNHSLGFSRFDGKYKVLEIIQCMNISLRSLKLDEV